MRIRSRLVATAVAGALFSVSTVATVSPARAIHRGHDARISSYPFMVSLRLAATPDSPRCGGTLIEADIVLTAAHCVAGVPQGGIVAVVGADMPDWRRAPRVDTLAHAIPETFDLSVDNRDDIAVVRLATPQSTPTVELATVEPRVRDHVGDRWVGLHQRSAGMRGDGDQPAGQPPSGARRGGVLRHATCSGPGRCTSRRRRSARRASRHRSTINRGDSGGPLLVGGRCGVGFRQVGVTTLGSDSTTKLYAGFTSIPVEADWIGGAIKSLRSS